MNSTNRKGRVLQERDRHLFRELAVMRIVDREQAKLVGRFGSDSRTNRRLRALTEAGFLRRFFLGTASAGRKAIYALSGRGALAVDVPYRALKRRRDEIVATDSFVQHQLTINSLYCSLKYSPAPSSDVTLVRWVPFYRPIADYLSLVPDGYLELKTPAGVLGHFLEVDLGNEPGSIWRKKAEAYVKLATSGEAERIIGQRRFRVLVIASSERRIRSIRTVVAKVVEKIFWFSTVTEALGGGFFNSVWLRPVGELRQSLIHLP